MQRMSENRTRNLCQNKMTLENKIHPISRVKNAQTHILLLGF